MARNLTTFDSGNRVGLKLTAKLHEQFVSIVAQTGRISIASGKCGLGVSTARHWMTRGHQEESAPYREFLDAVERARSDFLLFANRQLNRLATGGLVQMQSFDKAGNPIRNHKPHCGAAPGYPCDCELIIVEKVLMPDPQVLMWTVDRLDPSPNGEPAPDVPGAPALSDADALAVATSRFDLLTEAVTILAELGVAIPQLLEQRAIETTSSPVPEPATPTAPPKTDLIDAF